VASLTDTYKRANLDPFWAANRIVDLERAIAERQQNELAAVRKALDTQAHGERPSVVHRESWMCTHHGFPGVLVCWECDAHFCQSCSITCPRCDITGFVTDPPTTPARAPGAEVAVREGAREGWLMFCTGTWSEEAEVFVHDEFTPCLVHD
jgi:hypothetical protein